MPLNEDRVIREGGYLHNGKEVVLFHNPLTVEEWEEILENQKKAEILNGLEKSGDLKNMSKDQVEHHKIFERLKKRIDEVLSELKKVKIGGNVEAELVRELEQLAKILGEKIVVKEETKTKTSTTKD